MAIRRRSDRRSESGLTLIEALVIVTLTSLIALILLPVVTRASGHGFALADRGLDAAEAGAAEGRVRALLAAAAQQPEWAEAFRGEAQSMTFAPALANQVSCASAGARAWVRLVIEPRDQGGSLVCVADRAREVLLEWRRGEASFAYSAEGRAWSPSWVVRTPAGDALLTQSRPAPLARFTLVATGAPTLEWIERVGAVEAPELPPEIGQ